MGQATKGGNYKGKQHQYLGKGSVSELPNFQRGGNLLKELREETARKQERRRTTREAGSLEDTEGQVFRRRPQRKPKSRDLDTGDFGRPRPRTILERRAEENRRRRMDDPRVSPKVGVERAEQRERMGKIGTEAALDSPKPTQREQRAKIGVEATIDALPTPKTVTKPARKPTRKPTDIPEKTSKQAAMPKLKKQTSVKDRKTTLSAAKKAGHLYYYPNGVKTAAVTKDMLKKFGFKSLRDFMNAQLGKKRKSK